ncbi:hypothetical protein RUM43_000375 [Polyplax serrata]|uniref:Uncharacterized protein n=1 Tax=Polyplax serrata TaxID=468196 RepID=A0AAN8XN17_POLSC
MSSYGGGTAGRLLQVLRHPEVMGIKKVMVEVLGRPGAGRSNKSKEEEEEEEVDGHCPVFGLQVRNRRFPRNRQTIFNNRWAVMTCTTGCVQVETTYFYHSEHEVLFLCPEKTCSETAHRDSSARRHHRKFMGVLSRTITNSKTAKKVANSPPQPSVLNFVEQDPLRPGIINYT